MFNMNADRWIALVSLIITTGAVLFSIWVYKRGEKRRIPTIVTSPTPEVLVKPVVSRFGDFAVTHKGVAIGRNGNAFFVFFWNDGQLPILQADVISPYRVSFPEGVRVLDLSVKKSTRTILGVETQLDSGEERDYVVIRFAVLEPGDGVQIQMIVDGPPD